MSRSFISDLVDLNFNRDATPMFKDGRFTLNNDSEVKVTYEGSEYKSQISLTADFTVVGRETKLEVVPGYTDYSGYNKKFITDTGTYDALAAIEEFSKNSIEKRVITGDTLSTLSRQPLGDSHEMYIYNMLITWMRAFLYQMSGSTDGILKVKACQYVDSHVSIQHGTNVNDVELQLKLGGPVTTEEISMAGWKVRDEHSYWSRPYVLHYSAGSNKQSAFYLSHALGRSNTSDLNFDVALPGLDATQLLLDPVGGDGSTPTDFSELPWDKPETLWGWIVDYVTMNRLDHAFAAALECLGAMAVQPTYSSQEANSWQHARLALVLGVFSPTRARVRSNLEGEPFLPSAGAREMLHSEANSPPQYILAAAMANYYMWYGYYTLIHNESVSIVNWQDAYTSSSPELKILRSSYGRLQAISIITGKKYDSCMTPGGYMYIDYSAMRNVEKLSGVTVLDGKHSGQVLIDQVYAPVSGCLIAGTLNEEFYTTVGLAPLYSFDAASETQGTISRENLLRLLTVYRLFGHDVTVRDNFSAEVWTAWAHKNQCIIEPCNVGFAKDRVRQVYPMYNDKRHGRSDHMPSIRQVLKKGVMTVIILPPEIRMTEWQKRKVPVREVQLSNITKKPVKIMVTGTLMHRPVEFKARTISNLTRPDFREALPEIPPSKPEGPTVTEVTPQSAVTASTGPSVETAG